MAAQSSAVDEVAIKCLVVGDAGIGKTSIVKRCVAVPPPPAPNLQNSPAHVPAHSWMLTLAHKHTHARTISCGTRVKGEGFFETYKTTLGVDFEIKRMKVNGESVRLQIWDIMGQERFQEVVRAYYQNTRGVFIVYGTY